MARVTAARTMKEQLSSAEWESGRSSQACDVTGSGGLPSNVNLTAASAALTESRGSAVCGAPRRRPTPKTLRGSPQDLVPAQPPPPFPSAAPRPAPLLDHVLQLVKH
ncbi:hypothetical protein Q5P01_013243 [Channa striata]|uniref:Uncharacterized protein n=1 Tax=Channa striata TaxID=64152 RepID=A0AA88SIY0_CHASR|nr:hypothetical protein Q5P01_013243 [Channa striata]